MSKITIVMACISAVLAIFNPATCATAGEISPSRPHILIILADDLGWNDVGYHGSKIRTPTIDRIVHEGVELDRFYAQPTCSPTRSTLMTGKSPARLGTNVAITKDGSHSLPLDEKILPEYLNDVGYRSVMVGKWHLGHTTTAHFPHERGFDHFYGFLHGAIGYWNHVFAGGIDWQRNGTTVREEGYATRLLAEEAVQLVNDHDPTTPLFLYLSMPAPHLPNEAPEESIAAYSAIKDLNRRTHAAMVSELDSAIGRVLAAFESQKMLGNTLIIFASDNGGQTTESVPVPIKMLAAEATKHFERPIAMPGLESLAVAAYDGGSDNSPLPMGKTLVREGGVRVPAAIWWPGRLMSDRNANFISASDLLPTIMDAIGAPLADAESIDGRSQLGTLTGESKSETPDYLVTGFDGEALYRYPWKMIGPRNPRLYNVVDDPLEVHDVSEDHPEIMQALLSASQNWPRAPGKNFGNLIFEVLVDPNTWGGPEYREPWAESAR